MRKKRTWIILGTAALIGLVGVALISEAQRGAAQSAAANVQLGRVSQASLSLAVESAGSVSPEAAVTLAFGASGTVARVNVQPGDRVQAGEVLAELDTSDLELQIAQQEQAYLIQQAAYSLTVTPDAAAIEAAEAQLASATAAYNAARQKYAANSTDQVLISCNNVDNARQTYDDAVTAYNIYLTNWRVQVNGTADISPQKAQLDRAKAAYDKAVIDCNLARSSVNDSSVLSALAQLEQARSNLASLKNPSEVTLEKAQVQLEQARLSLEQARRQLDKARIVAPFDGLITVVNVAAGGPSGVANPIGLADTRRYHVDVLVDETEIGQVQIGQLTEVTFDALPDVKATGKVTRIDPAGTINQGVVYYRVRTELDPTEAALLIDMTANVRIILATHTDVLAVPGGAVRMDAQGAYYVNVVDENGEARRVEVTPGFTDGELTEVSGDLQRGQRVYISEPPARQQTGLGLLGIRVGR